MSGDELPAEERLEKILIVADTRDAVKGFDRRWLVPAVFLASIERTR